MLMASSMAQLHYLGKEDQNEVQHDFLYHVTPLALALHDASGVINGHQMQCCH